MKHTPGPWRGGTMVDHTPSVYAGDRRICDVNGVSNGGRTSLSTPEGRANKKLIAAAPDLLAALQLLMNEFHQYDHANDEGSLTEKARRHCIKVARAAIKRAGGDE